MPVCPIGRCTSTHTSVYTHRRADVSSLPAHMPIRRYADIETQADALTCKRIRTHADARNLISRHPDTTHVERSSAESAGQALPSFAERDRVPMHDPSGEALAARKGWPKRRPQPRQSIPTLRPKRGGPNAGHGTRTKLVRRSLGEARAARKGWPQAAVPSEAGHSDSPVRKGRPQRRAWHKDKDGNRSMIEFRILFLKRYLRVDPEQLGNLGTWA
jgi:hypothetical protein